MARGMTAQDYPRIHEPNKLAGFLDEGKLVPHPGKISEAKLREIIERSVEYANRKSSREILDIPDKASDAEVSRIYAREGAALLRYFRKYCGDPASTAHECYDRHYSVIAKEQFHNRLLQKERLNAGWRYQRIALQCAQAYEDIMLAVSDFFAEKGLKTENRTISVPTPQCLIDSFGEECRKAGLVDEEGNFHDRRKLVSFFCTNSAPEVKSLGKKTRRRRGRRSCHHE